MKSTRRRLFSFLKFADPQRHFSWIQFFGWALLLLASLYGCLQVFQGFSAAFPWPELVAGYGPGETTELYAPIFWRVSAIFIAIFLVNALLGLVLLHRLTGPLVRVERVLNEIGDGRLPGGIVQFRRRDLIPEVAEALNRMIVSCRSRIAEFDTESGSQDETSKA